MTEQHIAKDKFVQFTYQIKDQGGSIVEKVDLPLNYIHGRDGGMYEKIEAALEGCSAGDHVEVALAPEESFGQPDPALTYTEDIDKVPPQYHQLGAQVDFQNESGEIKSFTVSKIENGRLTLDGNHPLAGQQLSFFIKVLEVRDATPQELAGEVPTGRDAVPGVPPRLH
jgi:FKBP-type peptidyl-prolyl cis-trans isomerase SlyD